MPLARYWHAWQFAIGVLPLSIDCFGKHILLRAQGVAELLAALPVEDDGRCAMERAVEFNHQEPNLLALLTRRDG